MIFKTFGFSFNLQGASIALDLTLDILDCRYCSWAFTIGVLLRILITNLLMLESHSGQYSRLKFEVFGGIRV